MLRTFAATATAATATAAPWAARRLPAAALVFMRGLASSAHHTAHLCDVVIVGGGVAGTALAAALANRPSMAGSRVALVESVDLFVKPTSTDGHFSNRVSSYTPGSVAFFKSLGVTLNPKRARPFSKMEVWDAVGGGRVSFDASTVGEDAIAWIIENNAVQAALVDLIGRDDLPGAKVEVFNKCKVKDIRGYEAQREVAKAAKAAQAAAAGVGDGAAGAGRTLPDFADGLDWPELVLESGERLKCRLLVGCDGANSRVREFVGADFFGWNYDQKGVVATLKVDDADPNVTAWQRFLPTGPVSMLPLARGYSSMVWSTTHSLADLLPKLPADAFLTLVNAAFHNNLQDLAYLTAQAHKEYGSNTTGGAGDASTTRTNLEAEAQWGRRFAPPAVNLGPVPSPPQVVGVQEGSRAAFPLRLRHTNRYVKERVALVGDAAHLIHPLAGQGLNLGLQDVQTLARVIGDAAENGADLGSIHVLQTYASERYLPNTVMIGAMDKFKWLFSNDVAPLAWLRSVGMDVFNSIEPVKRAVMGYASGRVP